jgi:hypothetical protein
MKRKRILIIVGVVVAVILALLIVSFQACLGTKEEAEEVVSALYSSIQEKDYESALDYYSRKFFDVTSEDEWLPMLAKIGEKLGDLVSYELTGWHVNMRYGTNPGTYATLTYRTKYSKHDAVETISLEKKGLSGFKITGHDIRSQGFLAD